LERATDRVLPTLQLVEAFDEAGEIPVVIDARSLVKNDSRQNPKSGFREALSRARRHR
jgi:hypothetical protein